MGVFTTGGSFGNVGFTTGLSLPFLERFFCGPAYFITRADKLLRARADDLLGVRIVYYGSLIPI